MRESHGLFIDKLFNISVFRNNVQGEGEQTEQREDGEMSGREQSEDGEMSGGEQIKDER